MVTGFFSLRRPQEAQAGIPHDGGYDSAGLDCHYFIDIGRGKNDVQIPQLWISLKWGPSGG